MRRFNYTIQQLRLTPRDGFGQHVKSWNILVNGHLHKADDVFGNIAHIFISCCRSPGLPARYVSGYLFTDDGNVVGSLMESHAWSEVWLPAAGWVSFDVSNGVRASEYHVRLSTGLDYKDACPVGSVRIGGGMETMEVSVAVQSMQQA